jgi:hypothetical protein
MKVLRLDMLAGRPPAACWKCHEFERAGGGSERLRRNLSLSRYRDRVALTGPDGTVPAPPGPTLDLRFSNACNLRCRICDPAFSSAWAAEGRGPGASTAVVKAYGDWDIFWPQLQRLLESGIEEISFLGGEPLIMEEHYRLLDFLISRKLTDVRLCYTTNFSTLRFRGRDVLNLWPLFPNVSVAASLDGSGRRGEYLRKGLRWEAVVANREEMLRRCPGVKFMISSTFCIFNALHLPDFHREWVEKGYMDINALRMCFLFNPTIYLAQVLPAALKEQVLEAYRRHQEAFLDAEGEAARGFAAAAHFMQARDRSDLLPEFVAMTRRLDQLRGEDCREVFPELAGLFEAKG